MLTVVTIAVCVGVTVLLGVVPGPVLDLAGSPLAGHVRSRAAWVVVVTRP